MWETCLGTNGFIARKLYGYDYSPEEILDHAQEMEYDGIEVHSQFDPFPNQDDDVAITIYAFKNHLSGHGSGWYSGTNNKRKDLF